MSHKNGPGPHARPSPELAAPLDGHLLIEASAGAGKTYAMTSLAARLIVEADYRIDQFLIVTFTVAAAGELRSRFWSTLNDARQALGSGSAASSAQACSLIDHWQRGGQSDDGAKTRLAAAIREFDRAHITTIHGFCQRALIEFALYARTPFRFDVSGNDVVGVAAAARDFWRRSMTNEDPWLLRCAEDGSFRPDEDTASWLAGKQTALSDIRGAGDDGELENLRRDWQNAAQKAEAAWQAPEARGAFDQVVLGDGYTWKKDRRDDATAEAVRAALDRGAAGLLTLTPSQAAFFGHKTLAGSLFKRTPPPPSPLLTALEQLGDAAKDYASAWVARKKSDLLRDAAATLHHQAWANRSLSFDGLLLELHDALATRGGEELAERIRRRYPIALIDEYQDTDRLQAAIFRKVYPVPGDVASATRLFLIGDPKQSIYRFRGADVFAYLETANRFAKRTDRRLDLTRNYRSNPKLVEATSSLFQGAGAFLLPEIRFDPPDSADRDSRRLVIDGEDAEDRPLRLQLFARNAEGKKWSKRDLTTAAARHTAAEIERLLGRDDSGEPRGRILAADGTSEPLVGGDIAVLVRKGDQGDRVAAELRRLGIDSVEMGTQSVFETTEADDLERFMFALCADDADVNVDGRLRGALSAELFGLDMHELARLRDDDATWARWKDRAGRWNRVWGRRGIATLMRRLIFDRELDCAANLLRLPDGPRRLTNYLHLADLLHEEETRGRLNRRGLIDWFRQARREITTGDETAQLRLESDEKLVKIVTIHRAKGLEFPITFCPFAWDGRRPETRRATADYYDREAERPVLDLRPDQAARDRQLVEDRADELRLLYVALTRARYLSVVVWAEATEAEHAPLAWLLRQGESPDEELAAALKSHAEAARRLDRESWLTNIRTFVAGAGGTIDIQLVDPPATRPQRDDTKPKSQTADARTLGRELERIRERTSYTALVRDTGAQPPWPRTEEFDRDVDEDQNEGAGSSAPAGDTPEEQTTAAEQLDVFGFPAGGGPGRCIHEIFERVLAPGVETDRIIREALARYRIDARWRDVALQMVDDALDAPLLPPGNGGASFRLRDVERPIVEMEFHLPVNDLEPGALDRVLAAHGYARGMTAEQAKMNGFLHGYVDVVACHDGRWYVADYKSNWLGPDRAAYSDAAIREAMTKRRYHLQYLLYLTALHRLLQLRLPEYDYDRHIGGAFYLFLRGIKPGAPGSGIYGDRPSRACIQAIDACFGKAR